MFWKALRAGTTIWVVLAVRRRIVEPHPAGWSFLSRNSWFAKTMFQGMKWICRSSMIGRGKSHEESVRMAILDFGDQTLHIASSCRRL